MINIVNKEVLKAFKYIQKGGVILYPTDTIWGIGCDATNCKAVEKIYRIKKRKIKTPMLSLVKNHNMIQSFSETPPNIINDVLDGLVEPTTVIYPKGKNLCKHILSEDKSIGFRIPNNKFCLELISLMNKPLVSTSANISNKPFPQSFADIDDQILSQVDYVVNLPVKNRNMTPSSIVKIKKNGEILKIR